MIHTLFLVDFIISKIKIRNIKKIKRVKLKKTKHKKVKKIKSKNKRIKEPFQSTTYKATQWKEYKFNNFKL